MNVKCTVLYLNKIQEVSTGLQDTKPWAGESCPQRTGIANPLFPRGNLPTHCNVRVCNLRSTENWFFFPYFPSLFGTNVIIYILFFSSHADITSLTYAGSQGWHLGAALIATLLALGTVKEENPRVMRDLELRVLTL